MSQVCQDEMKRQTRCYAIQRGIKLYRERAGEIMLRIIDRHIVYSSVTQTKSRSPN